MNVEEVHELTRIDPWFIREVQAIVDCHAQFASGQAGLEPVAVLRAKRLGFSDQMLDDLSGSPRGTARAVRMAAGIRPNLAQIDTTAAEFPAITNYLYSTYHAAASEAPASPGRKNVILGSGAYRIGSSVEFDWCCVSAALTLKRMGCQTIMVNYNPETVSTDYDICDRLYLHSTQVQRFTVQGFR